jgi:protein gp37
MPTLNWIGKCAVVEHHKEVPFHLLRNVLAVIRFLSLESLLGPLSNINLDKIHWVIVGGESGPRARPIDDKWVTEIRDQCI